MNATQCYGAANVSNAAVYFPNKLNHDKYFHTKPVKTPYW